jgi:peroxiredoxin Q/BCP
MLTQGQEAPDFALPDEKGEIHTLHQYQGNWLLLYFYPKDDTPGCTKEACSLRDHALQYEKNDTIVIGISSDSGESHKRFIAKYKLPFLLLSDKGKKVITAYGAANENGGTKRISYLIGPDGIIEKTYSQVNPTTHAQEVLADIEALR